MPGRAQNNAGQLINIEHARVNNGLGQLIEVYDALEHNAATNRLISIFTKLGGPTFTRFDMSPRFINDTLGGNVIVNWTIVNSDKRSLIKILADGTYTVLQTTDGTNAFEFTVANISATVRGYASSTGYVRLVAYDSGPNPTRNDVTLSSDVPDYDTIYATIAGHNWTLEFESEDSNGNRTYRLTPANALTLGAKETIRFYEDANHNYAIPVAADNPSGMLATNGIFSETAPTQNADYIIVASNSVAERRVHKEFYRWIAPGVVLQRGDESSVSTVAGTVLHIPITITRSGDPLPTINLASSLGTHVPTLRNFNAGNAESTTVILARTIGPGSQPQTDTITANASSDLPADVSPDPSPRTASDDIDITWSGFGG